MKKICTVLVFFIGFLLTLSGESAVLVDITDPGSLKADDRYVYVTQGSRIYIYSRPGLRLVKKLGRPEENGRGFRARSDGRYPLYVDVNSDRILVTSDEKLSEFSKEFKLVREMDLPPQFGYVQRVGKVWTGTNYYWEKGPTVTEKIMLFRREGNRFKEIKTIHQSESGGGRITGLNPYKMNEYPVIPNILSHQSAADKVFVGRAEPGRFRIDIFSAEGDPLDTITGELKKLRVAFPDEMYELNRFKSGRLWKKYKRIIRPVVPEFYPAFRQFRVSESRIYLFTFQRREETGEVLILDLSGKRRGRIWLPLSRYAAVSNGDYFYLKKNQQEEWTLNSLPIPPEDGINETEN